MLQFNPGGHNGKGKNKMWQCGKMCFECVLSNKGYPPQTAWGDNEDTDQVLGLKKVVLKGERGKNVSQDNEYKSHEAAMHFYKIFG